MSIAYVVSSGEYSDYSVDCVFLSREAADEYVERRNRMERYESYRVEEFGIYDSVPSMWTKHNVYVWVNPPAHRIEDKGEMFDYHYVVVGDEPEFVPAHEEPGIVASSGPDLERCRKSCRDLYARVMAEREGIL